jgi:hypothetical protein
LEQARNVPQPGLILPVEEAHCAVPQLIWSALPASPRAVSQLRFDLVVLCLITGRRVQFGRENPPFSVRSKGIARDNGKEGNIKTKKHRQPPSGNAICFYILG